MTDVLVVDDEPGVSRLLCALLERDGNTVTVAGSGVAARAAAQSLPNVDLLIVDHSMPPDRGRDIAEDILLMHPAMKVLHVSGYPLARLESDGGLTGGAGFIQKPFTCNQFRLAVSAVLA